MLVTKEMMIPVVVVYHGSQGMTLFASIQPNFKSWLTERARASRMVRKHGVVLVVVLGAVVLVHGILVTQNFGKVEVLTIGPHIPLTRAETERKEARERSDGRSTKLFGRIFVVLLLLCGIALREN